MAIQQMLLGGSLSIDSLFSTDLYTGNATSTPNTQSIVNGIDLSSEGGPKTLPLPGGGSETANACPKPINCTWKETAGSCGYAGCGQTRYKTMTTQITTSAAHNGKCDKINGATRQEACGTGPCPIDCAGYWQDLNEYCYTKGGLAARPKCVQYQYQKYVRTQDGAHGGKTDCTANGTRQKKNIGSNLNCSTVDGGLC